MMDEKTKCWGTVGQGEKEFTSMSLEPPFCSRLIKVRGNKRRFKYLIHPFTYATYLRSK